MINSLDDLKKLLTLCRKQGVTDIELGPVKLKLGELPKKEAKEEITSDIDQDDDPLLPTQAEIDAAVGMPGMDPMAFYSAGRDQ